MLVSKNFAKNLLVAIACGIALFLGTWLLFAKVFSGSVVLQQTLHLGPLSIQYYGLILAIAVLAGYILAMRRRVDFDLSSEQADAIIFTVIVSGFVGARLYHVISSFPFYIHQPLKIFAVWNGGLSIYGVVIGGVVALYLYKRFYAKNISIWSLLDWLVPSVALGQVMGRFGNFVNYELFGNPTNLPWKMFVPIQFRVYPYGVDKFFHPLFLYEAVGSLVVLMLILRLKLKPGALFLSWLLMYNVLRFFLEQFRVGSVVYGGIRVNAIVSLVLIGVSVALYIKYVKPNPQNS